MFIGFCGLLYSALFCLRECFYVMYSLQVIFCLCWFSFGFWGFRTLAFSGFELCFGSGAVGVLAVGVLFVTCIC